MRAKIPDMFITIMQPLVRKVSTRFVFTVVTVYCMNQLLYICFYGISYIKIVLR